MSGYCPDCGNTQCICKEVERQENEPSSCMVDSIVLCPVCQRGDVWQEAVSRTEYVYKGCAVKDGQEVVDYLLAEVAVLLETHNAKHEPRGSKE